MGRLTPTQSGAALDRLGLTKAIEVFSERADRAKLDIAGENRAEGLRVLGPHDQLLADAGRAARNRPSNPDACLWTSLPQAEKTGDFCGPAVPSRVMVTIRCTLVSKPSV